MVSHIHAQGVNIDIASTDYQTGDAVTAPAYVSGFTKITAMQFALLYDTAALILTSITPGNVPGYGLEDFSTAGPGYNLKPGEIRSVFNSAYGATAPNNTLAFTLNFTAKQPGNTASDLAVYPQGLYPLAYKFPLVYIPLTIAFFDVGQSTGTGNPATPQYKIYPNPTAAGVTIESEQPQTVRVFDAAGRLEQQAVIQTGATYLHLSGESGIKFVQIGEQTTKIEKQ